MNTRVGNALLYVGWRILWLMPFCFWYWSFLTEQELKSRSENVFRHRQRSIFFGTNRLHGTCSSFLQEISESESYTPKNFKIKKNSKSSRSMSDMRFARNRWLMPLFFLISDSTEKYCTLSDRYRFALKVHRFQCRVFLPIVQHICNNDNNHE